jgi:hypothetical protein
MSRPELPTDWSLCPMVNRRSDISRTNAPFTDREQCRIPQHILLDLDMPRMTVILSH